MIPFAFTIDSDTFPGCSTIYRPIVPVRFIDNSGNRFKYNALIDTGSDHCIFHPWVAKELGLTLRNGEKYIFGGVGKGDLIAYVHRVVFYIEDERGKSIRIESDCGFSEGLVDNQIPYGILGQDGFFNKVNLIMNNKEKYFYIGRSRKARKIHARQRISGV